MIAGISKLTVNLSIWHWRFAHVKKASIKQLVYITLGMIIAPSLTMLLFCMVYVKTKMTKPPHQNPWSYSTTTRFCLYANIGGGGDIYTIFYGFQYFILIVYKATGYV